MNAPALANVGELDRRTYLGSSDAAAVMTLAPEIRGIQRTPYTTYLAKRGELDTELDPETRLFLRRRKRWEGPIVEMLREEYEGQIVGMNRRYLDPEYHFMAAEIDFEWVDGDGAIQNGEIKTVHAFAFGERHGWGSPGTGDIPIHYACQVSYGLMVTNRTRAIVAAMVGLDNMLFYQIDRDDEFIADMRARCAKFWLENVMKGIPPDAQTLADVKTMMLKKQGRPCQLDPVHMEKVSRLIGVRDQLRALAEEDETLSFEVGDYVCREWGSPNPYAPPPETVIKKKDAAGRTVKVDPLADAGLYYQGKRIASWNKQRGAYLDQRQLKEDKPELIPEYTRDFMTRILRFHKPT